MQSASSAKNGLNLAIGGFAYFQCLLSACRLGLFDQLFGKELTLRQLSNLNKVAPNRLLPIIEVCESLCLVERRGPKYTSPLELASLLSMKHPANIVPMLEAYHELMYMPFFELHQSLLNSTNTGLKQLPGKGKSIYKRIESNNRLQRVFYDWMETIAGNPVNLDFFTSTMQGICATQPRVLDIGGGSGVYGEILFKNKLASKYTLLDSRFVISLAQKKLKKTIPSDFTDYKSSLGKLNLKKYDLILLCHFVNIYGEKSNIKFFSRLFRELASGSSIVIFGSVSDSKDLNTTLLTMYFQCIATGEGRVYQIKEIIEMLCKSGFKRKKIQQFDCNDSNHFLLYCQR